MSRLSFLSIVCLAILWVSNSAHAQVPPFFNRGAALFDPEISIVNTGVVSDVQATVSHDRKYVTLNMRSSTADLVALREFAFQSGGNLNNAPTGFAGDPVPAVAPPARGDVANPNRQPLPSDVRGGAAPARQSILTREGMTLVGSARGTAAGAP